MSKLYSHEDLKILLLPYSLDYSHLDNDNKTKINERFKKTSNNISKITTKNTNVRSLKNNKKQRKYSQQMIK